MNKSESGIRKGLFQKKAVKIISICIIFLLAAGILLRFNIFGLRNSIAAGLFGAKNVSDRQLRTATVTKGDMNVTVTGSGAISSSNRLDVYPGVNSTITKVYFKEGDKVKEGDLMYELDDSDARLNIENIKNNIEQTKISQNTTESSIGKLKVTAPASGYVSDLTVREGDTVSKGSTVLNISESSEFKLTVPFNSFVEIEKGQEAEVIFPGSFLTMKGKVSLVSDRTTSTPEGGVLRNVEVSVPNPGYSLEGQTAKVEINANYSVENGTFAFAEKISVKSESGGTIEKLYVDKDQYVEKGTVLMELSNDELISSRDTTALRINDLQNQLDNAEKQLENYKIKAPISGTIIKQDAATGDAAERGTLLSTISDPDHMEFAIPIDELDIARIEVGQKASITVDALPESASSPLTGEVSKIAVEGNSQNGVTTYPVTITVNETSKLKAGMNANAEIMISQKTGVLMVPLEAIQKVNGKNFVVVLGSQQGAGNSAGGANGSSAGGENSTSGNSAGNTGSGNRARAFRGNAGANAQNQGNTGGTTDAGNYAAARARWIGGNSANMRNNSTAGITVMKPVELGVNNDDYAEVLSGLQEGEEVVLPALAANSGQNNAQIKGIGGMGFGGMGGIQAGGNARNSNARSNSPNVGGKNQD
ncbi:MAG: HlyD family efflux transporter periplasmic adaptor subunit [Ruminiclostridium sp.]|nr:HlyD family efflux transporter periplasmic adaptor subunit [Ruminiclostridium sp.]